MTAAQQEALAVIQDLQKAHVALDSMAQAELDKFLKSIRRAQEYIYRRTSEILAAVEANPERAASFADKLAWYRENWAAIERVAVRESGYANAVKNYLAGYDRLARQAEEMLQAGLPRVPGAMTRIPSEWIEYLKTRNSRWFDFLKTEALQKLDDTVLWNVLAGRSPGGLLAELKGSITGTYPWGQARYPGRRGLYEWHAGTYARTTHHKNVAIWKNEKANELGLQWRIYVGPVDSKTRSWCLDHVGRVYKVDQIEQMDNGQTGNVLVDRGGWNCRHDWDAIDDGLAGQIRGDQELEGMIQDELLEVTG